MTPPAGTRDKESRTMDRLDWKIIAALEADGRQSFAELGEAVGLVDDHVDPVTELARLLAADGVSVTQATLSRDLDELAAVKVRSPRGDLVYAVAWAGGDRTPRPGGPPLL